MKKIFILVSLFFQAFASFGQKNFISTDVLGVLVRRPAITYEHRFTHSISVVTEYRHYLLHRNEEGSGFFSKPEDRISKSITGGKITALARIYPNGGTNQGWFLESGFFGGRLELDYYSIVHPWSFDFFDTGDPEPPPIITTYNKRQNVAGLVFGSGFHPCGLEYLEVNLGIGWNIITIDGRFEPTSYQFYPYARLKLGIDW